MTTRAILASAIENWITRADLTGDIDLIILMAEADIAEDVRHTAQEKSLEISVTSGSYDLTSPTDLRVQKIRSLTLKSTTRRPELEEMAPSALRGSNIYTLAGTPTKFAIEGCNLLFAPTPSQAVPMFIVYFERFAALTADTDTNALLANHFQVYLYACLFHAANLAQDWPLADRYKGLYETYVAKLSIDQNRARRAATFQSTRLRNAR